MPERIHDDEPDTSEAIVRTLLAAERPGWEALPLEPLATSGTDNALWRLRVDGGTDAVVRLPRRRQATAEVERELALLDALPSTPLATVVRTPRVLHAGAPHEVFPFRWSVLEWIEGADAWSARDAIAPHLDGLATGLAEVVVTIGRLTGLPGDPRRPGRRGGPIEPLVETLHRWLDDPQWHASALLDVRAVRHLADEALEVAAEPVTTGFTHGDLIPGNLLVRDGRLASVIDWGGAGYGDLAQDLAPAWSVFEGTSRDVFRQATGADDAEWIRARTFELEHAVGGVLYYVPRRHPLGDVMRRTLDRILAG